MEGGYRLNPIPKCVFRIGTLNFLLLYSLPLTVSIPFSFRLVNLTPNLTILISYLNLLVVIYAFKALNNSFVENSNIVYREGCFVEGGGWRVDFRSVIKRGFS